MPSAAGCGVKYTIVCVGRPRSAGLAEAIEEYELRAQRYWPLQVHEVREVTDRDPAVVRRKESERLAKRAGSAHIVLCDVGGVQRTSVEFSAWMSERQVRASDVAFVIGGAWGTDDALVTPAERLSLAPWTLPHEMARLVLTEQLYRAGTICRREPYHK